MGPITSGLPQGRELAFLCGYLIVEVWVQLAFPLKYATLSPAIKYRFPVIISISGQSATNDWCVRDLPT